MADSRAREDALGNQELSECRFIDFDGIDILQMSLFYAVNISKTLILNANPSVVIELTFKVNQICIFKPQVIAGAKGFHHSCLPLCVCDFFGTLASHVDDVDSIFAQHHKVIGGQQEAVDRRLI